MNRRLLVTLLCVLTVVFVVYRPSLNHQFVNWDDDVHLLGNPFIKPLDGRHLQDIFTTTVNEIYIPLTLLSFAVEYHFFGAQPFIYHLDNVLLHLMVTAMVLLFALRCGLSLRAAAVGAFIFGVHPMHVESVAWVTQRKDVLYAFFYLLALLCYARHLKRTDEGRRKKDTFFVLTMVFAFLSVLAKPMALSLPLILMAADWFLRRPWSSRAVIEKVYCCAVIVPAAWMTYQGQMRPLHIDLPQSCWIWLWSLTFYLKKFFFPDYFVLLYKLPQPVSLMNPFYAGALFLFGLLILGFFFLRKNRLFLFAFLFYFCSIFFLLRWDDAADLNIVADRFMYLPSVGWCMFLGAFYDRMLLMSRGRSIFKSIVIVVGLTALGWVSFRTVNQIKVWYNGVSLWEHQKKYQPAAAAALTYNQLAQAYVLEGNFQRDEQQIARIIRYYESALAIKPDFAGAHYNLGGFYGRLEQLESAKMHFQKAIKYDPGHFEAYYQLGKLYQDEGRPQEAISAFRKAIGLIPDSARMYERVIDAYEDQLPDNEHSVLYRQEKERLMERYRSVFGRAYDPFPSEGRRSR